MLLLTLTVVLAGNLSITHHLTRGLLTRRVTLSSQKSMSKLASVMEVPMFRYIHFLVTFYSPQVVGRHVYILGKYIKNIIYIYI